MDKIKFPPFKFRADGLEPDIKRDLDDLIQDALKTREDKANELAIKSQELQSNLDSVKAEKEELEGKIQVLESQIQANSDNFDSAVNTQVVEKRRLERLLEKIGFRGDADKLTNRQVKEEIVKSQFSSINLDVSDAVLDGMFATVEELLKAEKTERQRKFDDRKQEIADIQPRLDMLDLDEIDEYFSNDNEDGYKKEKSEDDDMIAVQRKKAEKSRAMLGGKK